MRIDEQKKKFEKHNIHGKRFTWLETIFFSILQISRYEWSFATGTLSWTAGGHANILSELSRRDMMMSSLSSEKYKWVIFIVWFPYNAIRSS